MKYGEITIIHDMSMGKKALHTLYQWIYYQSDYVYEPTVFKDEPIVVYFEEDKSICNLKEINPLVLYDVVVNGRRFTPDRMPSVDDDGDNYLINNKNNKSQDALRFQIKTPVISADGNKHLNFRLMFADSVVPYDTIKLQSSAFNLILSRTASPLCSDGLSRTASPLCSNGLSRTASPLCSNGLSRTASPLRQAKPNEDLCDDESSTSTDKFALVRSRSTDDKLLFRFVYDETYIPSQMHVLSLLYFIFYKLPDTDMYTF